MEEIKIENAEFIENADLTIEDKIRIRLQELEDIKAKTIEALKQQQDKALGPINAAIFELTALLPREEQK